MQESNFIESYCLIKNNKVVVNDELVAEYDAKVGFDLFAKQFFKEEQLDYSKFFKMDRLSKLAFLASEKVLKNNKDQSDIAIVLSNRSSSLDIDKQHQDSINDKENYFPSPAVFVYTLPNICIGEISIKNGLHSENAFFIFDSFNPDFLHLYTNILLGDGKAEKVLSGWVEVDDDHFEAFLYLIGNKGNKEHNLEILNTLYKQ